MASSGANEVKAATMNISIVIVTFGRDEVLIETISELLALATKANEILVVDQTDTHNQNTQEKLKTWDEQNRIRLISIKFPSITRAMNIGLRRASSERVLFLDDDIIPSPSLVEAHFETGINNKNAIVAGRVLQPWHNGLADDEGSPFLFNSLTEKEVDKFIGCNVSVPRDLAISLGGFDTNFVRVAYHYEAEFAYRWRRNGYRIIYNPKALVQHLKAERGGTRSYGLHLTTTKPDHAVGRYYFNFSTKPMRNAIAKSIKDIFGSILTRHHLRRPLWVPLTLVAELRGLLWAMLLYSTGRGLMNGRKIDLLIVASHPVQYMSQIFQNLNLSEGLNTHVLYLTIPDSKSQSLGFKQEFLWDVPLLEGYPYVQAQKSPGKGLANGFMGVRVKNPLRELKHTYRPYKPDVVLLTGWHFWGMIQMFFSLIMSDIPIILRMDSNGLKKRNFLHRGIYRIFFSYIKICLTVGKANELFCINNGMDKKQLVQCPHIVNNDFFLKRATEARLNRKRIRQQWGIPKDAFCFIFAGKLQRKKNPLDLLQAFEQAYQFVGANIYLLIVGTGELEEVCTRYAMSHNLPVYFTGFLNQTQIPNSYAVSDCIVLPSNDDETWGLVINEAMACGLPAIVSDQAGCASDLIRDGVTGYKYKCGDIAQLKSLLIKIYEDRESAKVMGENAKSLIFERYNLRSVIYGIEKGVSCIHGPLEAES